MTKATRTAHSRGGRGGHEPRTRIRMREVRAAELAVLGWSQHRIAHDLGVSQAAVSKILKRIDLRVLRDLSATIERQKARHTLRLEHVYAEAMHAWEASKADSTRRRQRKTQTGTTGAGATIAEVVVEQRHGDPRYLEEARKALSDHRKLWGLDAPQKLDVRASSNRYERMTEDELRAAIARQQRLLEPAAPPTLEQRPAPSSATPSTKAAVHAQ